jgi:flagellar hook-associated protein 3 FlgL
MITRVTTSTMWAANARNLQTSKTGYANAMDRASSGKAINRASDDPAATADALKIRSSQAANTQYARNIDDGNAWLSTADSALSSVTSLLRRARDLTVQGANDGSMSAASKEALATELEQIRDGVLAQSNTKYLNRTIFAGSSDAGQAFDASFNFSGTAGSTVMRRVGDGQQVQVDVDGSAVFGSGSDSVFSDLNSIINDLRSGVNVKPGLTKIDKWMDAVKGAQSQVGSRQAAIESASDNVNQQKVLLESQRAGIEDVDPAEAIMELNMRNTAYQASLGVTAKALNTNLMDFLR